MILIFKQPTMPEIEADIAAHLRLCGWTVEKARDWEKPNHFCARMGITCKTLMAALKHHLCPKVEQDRGGNHKCGKLLHIAPTPAFEHFVVRHCKKEAAC